MTLEEAKIIAKLISDADWGCCGDAQSLINALSDAFPEFCWLDDNVMDRSSTEFAEWVAEQKAKERRIKNERRRDLRRRKKATEALLKRAKDDKTSKKLWIDLCDAAGESPVI